VQDRFDLFDISFQGSNDTVQENLDAEPTGSDDEGEVLNTEESSIEIFRQTGGSVLVNVEIADTQEKRTLGLSNRRNLGDYNGMLFVFDNPTSTSFWMKDMYIDLDILFIDSKGFVIDIYENVQPCETTCNGFSSRTGNFKYVLEVNSGFVNLNKVKIGDSISINL
jgi:uncharacterized membrane protein (UPF0127 family)